MPITADLSRKIVVLSENSRAILRAYQDSFREVFDGGSFSRILSDDVNFLEDHREKILPAFSVLLDVYALEYLKKYVQSLNTVLEEVVCKERWSICGYKVSAPALTCQEKIPDNDAEVLVYHLLIRLASVALNETKQEDCEGRKLIKVLQTFVEKIMRNNLLDKKDFVSQLFFSRTIGVFQRYLIISHSACIQKIFDIIVALEDFNVNHDAPAFERYHAFISR